MKIIRTLLNRNKKGKDPKEEDQSLPWVRLNMPEKDWRVLAEAFYALAHNNSNSYLNLPEHLKEHPVGHLCKKYIETKNYKFIEKAGVVLTGTTSWYVYLGR